MTSFDLRNVDPRSPNLHEREFLCGSTHLPSLAFLAPLGAEIPGGIICPPAGCVIISPSPAHVLIVLFWTASKPNFQTPQHETPLHYRPAIGHHSHATSARSRIGEVLKLCPPPPPAPPSTVCALHYLMFFITQYIAHI